MLFNSYVFIFVFLPLTLAVYVVLGRVLPRWVSAAWLVVASLVYYGWWDPSYLLLIGASIAFNYSAGLWISSRAGAPRRWSLGLGVAVNLALLGYYKYANFFVDSLNAVADTTFHLQTIILPLAISFFTFQQIAYLVDTFQDEATEHNFIDYCLFVSFFPQLIAGPIVHHKEMLPQFTRRIRARVGAEDLSVGASIFALGLFKKVVIADTMALYASPAFAAAENGEVLGLLGAWGGVFAYSMQIYFDFSGYSDMAIGIGRLFGIRLPQNFDSPYKSVNIIEFWRRWHMTLSRFLRDYLYIPLGGNRKGGTRRYVNLLATMVLGGLWHGAGWTFVVWGTLHGLFLVVNHAWHALRRRLGHDLSRETAVGRLASAGLTFVAVLVAWVFFRAESFTGARHMLASMSGAHGLGVVPQIDLLSQLDPTAAFAVLSLALLLWSWLLPNSRELFAAHRPTIDVPRRAVPEGALQWTPGVVWSGIFAAAFVTSVLLLSRYSEFIYFQF
jgi:alginate O-acetyltransferase complex protein AlgI